MSIATLPGWRVPGVSWKALVAAALGCTMWGLASVAVAQTLLDDYSLTSWTVRDGFPAGRAYAIAQDRDGYLWIGSEVGLVRFDGMRFTRWQGAQSSLPTSRLTTLVAAADGSLWAVFFDHEGVFRVSGQDVRHFHMPPEASGAPIVGLAADRQGAVWVTTVNDVRVIDANGHWRSETEARGLPRQRPMAPAYVDAECGVFIALRQGLYNLSPQDSVFRKISDVPPLKYLGGRGAPVIAIQRMSRLSRETQGSGSNCADVSARIYITDPNVGFRALQDSASGLSHYHGRGFALMPDRFGHIWLATNGDGIWEITASAGGRAAIRMMTASSGLSTEGAGSLLEDREGNIWAGTTNGIVRFTRHTVDRATDIGVVSSVASTPDGSMWVSTEDGLLRLNPERTPPAIDRRYFGGSSVRALSVDATGVVWAGTEGGIARIAPRSSEYTIVRSSDRFRDIVSIAGDGAGHVWVYDREQGLVRVDVLTGVSTAIAVPGTARNSTQIVAILVRRDGTVWLTASDSKVMTVTPEGSVTDVGQPSPEGPARAIYEDTHGQLWFGTMAGLSMLRRGHFQTVHLGQAALDSTAIVEDRDGYLWVAALAGLIRIPYTELQKAMEKPDYEPTFRLYDSSDGLPGTPRGPSDRGAAWGTNGSLYVITRRGIAILDPSGLAAGTVSRPEISGVVVDDKPIRPEQSAVRLSPRTKVVQIEFSALNLTSASKTRFRYRLDGFDGKWIDSDLSAKAVYTNLGPGTYDFRVMASSDVGTWSDRAAIWSFTVERPFYQTPWFAALGLTATGLMVWAMWQMRTLKYRQDLALVLKERARMSREIHDTILQRMAGIALQMADVSRDADELGADLGARLVSIRRQLDQGIGEARRAIWSMRPQQSGRDDFIATLETTLSESASSADLDHALAVKGPPRRCPQVEATLLRIAQEAIVNATRHSEATTLRVELEYAARTLALTVSDNGQGFDTNLVGPDHFGLMFMKERAEQLGGTFQLKTDTGVGTTIEVVVPIPIVH